MAATPSAEDTDVWLLIVCNDVGITASLMHSTGFPSGIPAAPRLVLRSDGFPIVTVVARSVQQKQISIEAPTTRHLFPLIAESDRLVVSVGDGNIGRDYTFSLRPNRIALAGIARCLAPEE